jgi:hypothetical protein
MIPVYEGQIQEQDDGSFILVVTTSFRGSCWSGETQLKARNWADADKEASGVIRSLRGDA